MARKRPIRALKWHLSVLEMVAKWPGKGPEKGYKISSYEKVKVPTLGRAIFILKFFYRYYLKNSNAAYSVSWIQSWRFPSPHTTRSRGKKPLASLGLWWHTISVTLYSLYIEKAAIVNAFFNVRIVIAYLFQFLVLQNKPTVMTINGAGLILISVICLVFSK